jgi:hypothetical protein
MLAVFTTETAICGQSGKGDGNAAIQVGRSVAGTVAIVARTKMLQIQAPPKLDPAPDPIAAPLVPADAEPVPPIEPMICPHCQQGRLIFIRRLTRPQAMGSAPPTSAAAWSGHCAPRHAKGARCRHRNPCLELFPR